MKKIIAVFCSIAICFSLSVLAFAEETSSMDKGNFWDYVAMYNFQQGNDAGGWVGAGFNLIGTKISDNLGGSSCSYSDDNLHHGEIVRQIGAGRGGVATFECKCDYCGGTFTVTKTKDDLSAAYDSYVSTLPAPSYGSGGELRWRLNVISFEQYNKYALVDSFASGNVYSVIVQTKDSYNRSVKGILDEFTAPISGKYRLSAYYSSAYSGAHLYNSHGSGNFYLLSSPDGPISFSRFLSVPSLGEIATSSYTDTFLEGAVVVPSSSFFLVGGEESEIFSVSGYFELVCTPAILYVDTYNTNTRPTSITGGNYGIVGDNGQITKVEDNSTIINETNNTYYNPATGQTVPITGWSYDYSDRSYKVTMEGGKTSTVTYGDENISITETTVNESGDTITNNYTIYYLINGSETPVDPPAVCEHDWQESNSTDPTCTLPGKVTLSCTKCQQTKTETIPALGHDWQMKQTVTTQYDETGQLVQEGYTIFECSRCHEQYKSPDGTIPPGGGSGTDPGGEEGGTTIGGLIEKLLSGVGSVVGGIIKGLLSLLTKAVEALAGLAELFTTFVGSLVELWGGFTSFLSAVFPFLPEEFVIIIELGLILMIAAAVFRKFIS